MKCTHSTALSGLNDIRVDAMASPRGELLMRDVDRSNFDFVFAKECQVERSLSSASIQRFCKR